MPDVFPNIGSPDWGLSDQTEEDLYEAEMGDGYLLSMPAGLNYQREVWNVSWSSLDPAVAASTYAWLKARKKITPFLWDHPDGYQVQVRCRSVTHTRAEFGNSTLRAVFAEDFNP